MAYSLIHCNPGIFYVDVKVEQTTPSFYIDKARLAITINDKQYGNPVYHKKKDDGYRYITLPLLKIPIEDEFYLRYIDFATWDGTITERWGTRYIGFEEDKADRVARVMQEGFSTAVSSKGG